MRAMQAAPKTPVPASLQVPRDFLRLHAKPTRRRGQGPTSCARRHLGNTRADADNHTKHEQDPQWMADTAQGPSDAA